MALVCGLSAAGLAIAGDAPSSADKPLEFATLASPSIAGRWSGTPHAVRHDASRCGPDGCKLVLDIVACGAGWCGIEVDRQNTCAGEALQLAVHRDPKREAAFEGRFSLGKDTQGYVVEATFEAPEEGRPARLYLVGDTGPEFMMFRRSFPFHAALTRTGDPVCETDKPVS